MIVMQIHAKQLNATTIQVKTIICRELEGTEAEGTADGIERLPIPLQLNACRVQSRTCHVPSLRTIGRYAAVIVALYYLYSGVLLFAGGISQL